MTTPTYNNEGRLLKTVNAIAISPESAHQLVRSYEEQLAAKYPTLTDSERAARVAEKLISRFARLASVAGVAAAAPGAIPGIGTSVAVTGGALADTALCMKYQVDITMCMAVAYGYDITTEDARHMTFLIAAGAATEKAGTPPSRASAK